MIHQDQAHSLSTGHSVMVNVSLQDGYITGGYGSLVWIDWACCACPQRGRYGGQV